VRKIYATVMLKVIILDDFDSPEDMDNAISAAFEGTEQIQVLEYDYKVTDTK
jgi:hypothetical protein